ncbi:MAG: hypothetical protein AW07_01312 [Candidatus Accumulibacter sp. SK-11]|nr:MAG: hypothetical protein AW07_01312 [Candidatus Accumulibacter sp. SK-11]
MRRRRSVPASPATPPSSGPAAAASSAARSGVSSGARWLNSISTSCSSRVSANGGGSLPTSTLLTAAGRRRRSTCTTTVPAARSPSRLPSPLSRLLTKPAAYSSGRKSMARSVLRMNAALPPTGRPSSRTTANPHALLPGV